MLIYGQKTNFNENSILDFDYDTIIVVDKVIKSPTFMTVFIDINKDSFKGFHNLTITTDEETANDDSIGLLLVRDDSSQPATINNIVPAESKQDSELTLTISSSNTNFIDGITEITFLNDNGIEVLPVEVINKTQATVTIKIAANASKGKRDIYITTGGEIVALLNAFTVTASPVIDEPNAPPTVPDVEVDKPNIPTSIPELEETEITPSIIELTEKTKIAFETTEVIIVVKRTENTVDQVTVKFTTLNGSAKAGEDFIITNGTLTWEDGDSKDKEITISILADENIEEDETFTLKLTDVTGNASLGLTAIEITILDDDIEDDSTSKIPEDDSTEIESEDKPVELSKDEFANILTTTEPPKITTTSSLPKKCPDRSEIHTYCTFQNREVGDTYLLLKMLVYPMQL